jgi:hypothetical protein
MRAVPVAVAVFVVLGGMRLQLWGTNGEVPADSTPTNYVTKSSDGTLKQESVEAGPRAGKNPDTPLLSQADQPYPADGTNSGFQRRVTRPHRVTLSWQPSANALTNDDFVGYNVFRCSGLSARCARINRDPVPIPEYVDDQVRGGYTYYYATTAVNQAGKQSRHSNVIKVVIPFP